MNEKRESKYGAWTIKQLVAELRKRGAFVTGKKADLIKRLEDYDNLKKFRELVNEDIGDKSIGEEPYVLNLPHFSLYKDLNASHTLSVDKNFDKDYYSTFTGSVNEEKAKKLYETEFLISLRKAVDTENNTFLCAQVAAELKKSVRYFVNIKITEYKYISDATCECAAGKGPTAHCKHVVIVIQAMIDFITNKKLILRETCTEKLQSHDRPKKLYNGSPVKAKDLKLSRVNAVDNFMKNYDPRPEKFRKMASYSTDFRNKCINFAALRSQSFPELQLYESVNLRGFYYDHDYCGDAEENFFKMYNLTSITADTQKEIEQSTQGQSKNKQWMIERSFRISSSMFGDVLYCTDPVKTVKNLLSPTDISHVPAIMHGKKCEIHALRQFECKKKIKYQQCGLFVHMQYSFLAASPDAVINEETCVEVKCPYSARNDFISPETVEYLYLCEKEGFYKLRQDHKYYCQVQGQLLCTQKKLCVFIVYTFKDMYVVTIGRDEEFIANMTLKLIQFYENYYKKALLDQFLYKGF